MPIAAALSASLRRLATVALLGLAGNAHAATGCPWISATDSSNRGIVDTNAAYWSSVMPAYVPAGTSIQIYASYPQLRFFNFTIYHGGKMIDHLTDADLYPVEGGSPNANLAVLPDFASLEYHYLVTIKYEDLPAIREPNTLYAGSSTTLSRLLLLRNYLPDAGLDSKGGVDLPELTQINADGSSQRYDTTSSNLACPFIAWASAIGYKLQFVQVGVAVMNPTVAILPLADYNVGGGLFPPYSNFDAGYGGFMSTPAYGDLLLIRSKLPATPRSGVDPADVQARYYSVCAYRAKDRTQLGCLTDAQLVTQDDGYFTIVVSTAGTRPPLADNADGYNWLPWYSSTDRESFTLRELLPDPDFAGNYQTAGNAADPISALGEWAPVLTYCSAATFNANASSGGAALFAACQAGAKFSNRPAH